LFRLFITSKHFPMLFWIFSVEITAEKRGMAVEWVRKRFFFRKICVWR
jgi:hypothetical protein